jgi:hypothetical protein
LEGKTMSERLVRERYLTVAARLEGLIAAHRILKGDDGDEFDRQLWRLTDETIAEVYGDE